MKLIILFCVLLPLIYGQGLQEDPPDDVGSRRGKRSPQGLLDNTEIRVNGLQEDPPDDVGSRRGKRSPHGFQEDPPDDVGSRRGKRSPQGLLDNTEIRVNEIFDDKVDGVEFENRGKRSPELFDNNNNGVEFESIPRAAGLIRRARCANPPPSALKQGRREHDPIELSAVTFIPPPYPLF
ncbi:PREDICTED: uncharacterized protein LOC106125700 isoform X4 [Papilio xuthus]|uniref:Uncharacterized protein LOC106125700 isoform X3 n=1 Tax=Papilio xuthus TaxID=66420 RepID=A0AAJ7EIB6_PAPXU|nr:PREDICTED: uncharacterized protein LOC106125700 isoform X3 [Papilio xuthus]XP_013178452.1 PREDICTED: uncharacterized protein LOC106125700 isoform X4 [Papilio xuthus]